MSNNEQNQVNDLNALKSSEPWEKSSHPLFLHHFDKPGAILVSQPLEEDNYTTWQQSMTWRKQSTNWNDAQTNQQTDHGVAMGTVQHTRQDLATQNYVKGDLKECNPLQRC